MKPIFQDVIPPKHKVEKKTLHSIEAPARSRAEPNEQISAPTKSGIQQLTKPQQTPQLAQHVETHRERTFADDVPKLVSRNKQQITIPSIKPEQKRQRKFPIKTLITIVLIGCLGFLIYWYVGVRATVSVDPKMKEVYVSNSYTAKLKPTANELAFSAVTITKEKEVTVPATGKKKLETRATGKVVLYNTFSSVSQRLIKNTRLESAKGMIYRLDTSIMIPGKTKKGSEEIPGSIEVSVTADEAGEEYNSGLTDFTIPGFKGEPRYSKFYGRSKTTLEGGFSGTIKTASDEEIVAAEGRLREELTSELKDESIEKIPSGFITFQNGSFLSTERLKTEDPTTIRMKGTLHTIIFDKAIISSRVAKDALNINDDLVTASKLEQLSFIPDPNETMPWETGNLPFSLNGTTTLLWTYNRERLKEDLAGKPVKIVPTVLSAYPGIDHAEVSVFPKWKSTMPTDPKKINIVDSSEVEAENTPSIFTKNSVPVMSTTSR